MKRERFIVWLMKILKVDKYLVDREVWTPVETQKEIHKAKFSDVVYEWDYLQDKKYLKILISRKIGEFLIEQEAIEYFTSEIETMRNGREFRIEATFEYLKPLKK